MFVILIPTVVFAVISQSSMTKGCARLPSPPGETPFALVKPAFEVIRIGSWGRRVCALPGLGLAVSRSEKVTRRTSSRLLIDESTAPEISPQDTSAVASHNNISSRDNSQCSLRNPKQAPSAQMAVQQQAGVDLCRQTVVSVLS